MKLVSPRLIAALVGCGFTITGTVEVEEEVVKRGLWDDYYKVGRRRTMTVLRQPAGMSGGDARRLARAFMGAFQMLDNAPSDALRRMAGRFLEELKRHA